jgi:hypothetical protein
MSADKTMQVAQIFVLSFFKGKVLTDLVHLWRNEETKKGHRERGKGGWGE